MRTVLSFARSAGCAAALAMAAASVDARADTPTDDATPLAEALFQQGRDLFKRDRYGEACPKFMESQRLQPKLGTLLNLALCHEKLGKIASAWGEYTSAATIAHRMGEKEREEFAREQVAALSKALSHVTLKVSSPPPGLTVLLDDKPLEEAALNVPLPIDPGKHSLVVTAPRRRAWSTSFDVAATRSEIPVEIPALEPTAEAEPLPAPPSATALPLAPPTPPPPTASMPPAIAPTATATLAPSPAPAPSSARMIAYVGFGVGGASLLLGAVTGAMALAKSGAVIDACPGGHCPADQRGELSTVNALANASNVGFALGAVGLGVGLVGILVGRPSDAAPAARASITPILGPGAIGIRGAF